ncbi:UDP-N-acetylmuramoyl-tripeptide--D-alanyl-D-alanine ligase [Sphingorhabdus arenilitoris]|uniref:UDP-N-acetylmuramoyl-tripeptide--D-alanyl-D-alanine ligase n=1 Tax=Sphingorhabdus arenilitoris TaxID=1490041 RepID=A0ABV8REZ6_9SPHN
MKLNWTSDELAAATGGTESGSFTCSGVAFDSREIGAGDLFFALKGEASDGHNYLDQVYANGAAGAVVDRAIDRPHILVADTAKALNDLAKASRARVDAKIIGVTGSAGKTGTKEALFAALDRSSRGYAHRSVKSYNNHVGVPLSLSRMPAETQFGVFEMGMNHAGELRELTALVRPDVAIVTTIAPAHIEFFNDETEIAKAKAEIFEGLSPEGTAIIPADNAHYQLLREAAEKYTQNIVSFGFSEHADVRAADHVAVSGGTMITAQLPSGGLCYTLSQPGKHWIANSLAVLAAVEAVGGDLAAAGLAMAELGGLAGRGARHQVSVDGGDVLLIDESYNANPASMAATLSDLANQPGGRRIAVLADMKELGTQSAHFHTGLAAHLASAKVDYAILVGEEMQNLVQSLKQGVEGPAKFDHCGSAQEALTLLQGQLQPDDIVLVKGSNSMGLSAIINAYAGGGD